MKPSVIASAAKQSHEPRQMTGDCFVTTFLGNCSMRYSTSCIHAVVAMKGFFQAVARMEAAGRNPGPDVKQVSRISLRSIRATEVSGTADV
jgi:hypothetical protein